VAGFAAALLVMSLWFAATLIFDWRFHYSIRSLLVLALVVAIVCGWLAAEMQRAKAQYDAVMNSPGGLRTVFYDNYDDDGRVRRPRWPWLTELLGEDFSYNVVALFVSGIDDYDLEKLKALSALEELEIRGQRVVSGGLRHVNSSHLRKLALEKTDLNDDSLRNIERFT
jgi:hypothetical protein